MGMWIDAVWKVERGFLQGAWCGERTSCVFGFLYEAVCSGRQAGLSACSGNVHCVWEKEREHISE